MGFSNTFTSALTGAGVGFVTGGLPGLAIGAGIGGLAGYQQDYNNTQAQAASNRAMAQQLAMWNMQNEYNSPVQQMARLREAGLNPMLVYGGGNVSGNSASAIGSPQTYANKMNTMASIEGIQALADLKATGAQTAQAHANTLATQQDITNMQTANKLTQANLDEQLQNVQMNQLDLDYAKREQKLRFAEQDIRAYEMGLHKNWNESGAGDLEFGAKKATGFLKDLFGVTGGLANTQASFAQARLNNVRANTFETYIPRYRSK